jgi:hypothetical protein
MRRIEGQTIMPPRLGSAYSVQPPVSPDNLFSVLAGQGPSTPLPNEDVNKIINILSDTFCVPIRCTTCIAPFNQKSIYIYDFIQTLFPLYFSTLLGMSLTSIAKLPPLTRTIASLVTSLGLVLYDHRDRISSSLQQDPINRDQIKLESFHALSCDSRIISGLIVLSSVIGFGFYKLALSEGFEINEFALQKDQKEYSAIFLGWTASSFLTMVVNLSSVQFLGPNVLGLNCGNALNKITDSLKKLKQDQVCFDEKALARHPLDLFSIKAKYCFNSVVSALSVNYMSCLILKSNFEIDYDNEKYIGVLLALMYTIIPYKYLMNMFKESDLICLVHQQSSGQDVVSSKRLAIPKIPPNTTLQDFKYILLLSTFFVNTCKLILDFHYSKEFGFLPDLAHKTKELYSLDNVSYSPNSSSFIMPTCDTFKALFNQTNASLGSTEIDFSSLQSDFENTCKFQDFYPIGMLMIFGVSCALTLGLNHVCASRKSTR